MGKLKLIAWIIPQDAKPEIRGKVLVDIWFGTERAGNLLVPKEGWELIKTRFADAVIEEHVVA